MADKVIGKLVDTMLDNGSSANDIVDFATDLSDFFQSMGESRRKQREEEAPLYDKWNKLVAACLDMLKTGKISERGAQQVIRIFNENEHFYENTPQQNEFLKTVLEQLNLAEVQNVWNFISVDKDSRFMHKDIKSREDNHNDRILRIEGVAFQHLPQNKFNIEIGRHAMHKLCQELVLPRFVNINGFLSVCGGSSLKYGEHPLLDDSKDKWNEFDNLETVGAAYMRSSKNRFPKLHTIYGPAELLWGRLDLPALRTIEGKCTMHTLKLENPDKMVLTNVGTNNSGVWDNFNVYDSNFNHETMYGMQQTSKPVVEKNKEGKSYIKYTVE